jgi:hypothetical protein
MMQTRFIHLVTQFSRGRAFITIRGPTKDEMRSSNQILVCTSPSRVEGPSSVSSLSEGLGILGLCRVEPTKLLMMH